MKALLFAVLFASVSPALSGTLPPDEYGRLSDSDILQAWSLANKACLHTPPACEQRDAIDREMPGRGYCYVGAGAAAHWSKCDDRASAQAPPQPAPPRLAEGSPEAEPAAPGPAPIPEPGSPADAWRDDCLAGATSNTGECDEIDARAESGGPAFEAPPDRRRPIVEEGTLADMPAQGRPVPRFLDSVYSCAPDDPRATGPHQLVSLTITLRPDGQFGSVVYRAANGAAYDRGRQYEAVNVHDETGRYWTGTLRVDRNVTIVGSLRRANRRLIYDETIRDASQGGNVVARVTSVCDGQPSYFIAAPSPSPGVVALGAAPPHPYQPPAPLMATGRWPMVDPRAPSYGDVGDPAPGF